MAKKKRAICAQCKGKKYLKFLAIWSGGKKEGTFKYQCKNKEKCASRGANYRK